MSKARRDHLRGQSALVRSQFTRSEDAPDAFDLHAYTVTFTDAKPGLGRSHKAAYVTACVIAGSVHDAGAKAERYCKENLSAKMYVEEIRLDENLVIE